MAAEVARLNEAHRLLVATLLNSAQRKLLAHASQMGLSPKQICTLVLVAEGAVVPNVDTRAVHNLVGRAIGDIVDEGNLAASLDALSGRLAARALAADVKSLVPGELGEDEMAYIGSLQATASEPLTVEALAQAIVKRRQSSSAGNDLPAAMRASQSL